MITIDTTDLSTQELFELYATLKLSRRGVSKKVSLVIWKATFDLENILKDREEEIDQASIEL